jgi:hypothetical protein
MTMTDDDERFDIDPRWEVQPETNDEDDSGASRRWLVPMLLAVAAGVAALIWAAGNVAASS